MPERGLTQPQAGADLSYLPLMEYLGAEYRVEGVPQDALEIFSDNGHSLIRLRLWHTPEEPWHGLDSTVSFAQRIVGSGMDFMLDYHLSDTWADPGNQTKPAAWQNLDFNTLADSVYRYTNESIARFRQEDALPAHVQIGNEITPGLLWDDGRVGWQYSWWDNNEQWDQLAELINSAISGVLDSLSAEEQPEIILHLTTACDNQASRWWLDNILDRGVEFDVIGLSYYPWWHGTLQELEDNLFDLAYRYGKYIQIVETSYPWTLEGYDQTNNFVWQESQLEAGYPATTEGQCAFFTDLYNIIDNVPGSRGDLMCFWEPAWLALPNGPGNPSENLTLFDFDGDALPALSFLEEMEIGYSTRKTPVVFQMIKVYPNPFNAILNIELHVPKTGDIKLAMFDIMGREAASLINGYRTAGLYDVVWDAEAAASGVYFVQLIVDSGQRSGMQKVLLIK